MANWNIEDFYRIGRELPRVINNDLQAIIARQSLQASPTNPRIAYIRTRELGREDPETDRDDPNLLLGFEIENPDQLRDDDWARGLTPGISRATEIVRTARLREIENVWLHRLDLTHYHIDPQREFVCFLEPLPPGDWVRDPTPLLSLVLGQAIANIIVQVEPFHFFITGLRLQGLLNNNPVDIALARLRADNPHFAHMFRDEEGGLQLEDVRQPRTVTYILGQTAPRPRRADQLTIVASAPAGQPTRLQETGHEINLEDEFLIQDIMQFWQRVQQNRDWGVVSPRILFIQYERRRQDPSLAMDIIRNI